MRLCIFPLLFASCLILTTGCEERKIRRNQVQGPRAVGGAPNDLKDPLLQDRQPKPLVTPARYRATGKDEAGGTWEGYLFVETADAGYLQSGYFEWQRNRGERGRYHFEGAYNPLTKTVRWTGFTIDDRAGRVCNAIYTATFTDGRRFENGRWSGGISVPGTWEAEVVGGEE